MELTVQEIADLLGGNVEGDHSQKINQIAKIQEGSPGSIAFLSNQKYESYLYSTQASAVIVNRTLSLKKEISTTLIRVDDAYSAFSVLLDEYVRMVSFQKVGIEQPVFIHDSAQLGEGVYIGAFAYIGAGTKIGDNCKIYPQAYTRSF